MEKIYRKSYVTVLQKLLETGQLIPAVRVADKDGEQGPPGRRSSLHQVNPPEGGYTDKYIYKIAYLWDTRERLAEAPLLGFKRAAITKAITEYSLFKPSLAEILSQLNNLMIFELLSDPNKRAVFTIGFQRSLGGGLEVQGNDWPWSTALDRTVLRYRMEIFLNYKTLAQPWIDLSPYKLTSGNDAIAAMLPE